MVENKKVPLPVDVAVGARIRRRRNEIGMSQEKLGEALGITFQQIQKYEKGTNRVGASRLQALSAVLAVPVAFFFEDIPEGVTPIVAPEPMSRDAVRLGLAFQEIKNPAVRRKVLDLVLSLATPEE